MNRVFILCSGSQQRWDGNGLKHLVMVDEGIPLLQRTINQANLAFQTKPIIVCDANRKNEISGALDRQALQRAMFLSPNKSDCVCETFLSTLELWSDMNYILLGDVYYSALAIDTIIRYDKMFFGDNFEIFAVKFDDFDYYMVNKRLSQAIIDYQSGGLGKLWNFYRAWCGIPMNRHKEGHRKDYMFIYDETTDFDTVEQYDEFMAAQEER